MLKALLALALLFAASAAHAGQQMQGQQMQGQQMQGLQMQGTSLSGGSAPPVGAAVPLLHSYSGWVVSGHFNSQIFLEQGRLTARLQNGKIVSGTDLAGAYGPATSGGAKVWTYIRGVQADPTFPQGDTLLYSMDLFNADGSTSPLCAPDLNGVSAAIPVAAVFDQTGARVESTTQFIFGCTSGVIAKCYRWGYRPWLTGTAGEDFAQLHLACTRLARADYCGNGKSWTRNGTLINLWDRAPAPGPFQDEGTPTPDFLFEAGWSAHGAVCLSKQRWATLPPDVAADCPDRLIAPGVSTAVGTVCDTENAALQFDTTTQLFNQSKLNAAP